MTTEKIKHKKDVIWLDQNNFIRIRPNEGFEFDEKDVQRQFDTYANLASGMKHKSLLLVDATHDFLMTKEARELSAKKAKDHFNGVAIISNSFATRLLINFLNSFYNFGIPIKLFTKEVEAVKWLNTLKKK